MLPGLQGAPHLLVVHTVVQSEGSADGDTYVYCSVLFLYSVVRYTVVVYATARMALIVWPQRAPVESAGGLRQ